MAIPKSRKGQGARGHLKEVALQSLVILITAKLLYEENC